MTSSVQPAYEPLGPATLEAAYRVSGFHLHHNLMAQDVAEGFVDELGSISEDRIDDLSGLFDASQGNVHDANFLLY